MYHLLTNDINLLQKQQEVQNRKFVFGLGAKYMLTTISSLVNSYLLKVVSPLTSSMLVWVLLWTLSNGKPRSCNICYFDWV